jgi:hypothetical protein
MPKITAFGIDAQRGYGIPIGTNPIVNYIIDAQIKYINYPTTYSSNNIMYSFNGRDFFWAASNISSVLTSGYDKFFGFSRIGGSGGSTTQASIYTSNDGILWTTIDITSLFSGIYFYYYFYSDNSGVMCGLGYDGTRLGIAFTALAPPNYNTTIDYLIYSNDGINWNITSGFQPYNPLVPYSPLIIYGQNAAQSPFTPYVMVRVPYSNDGVNNYFGYSFDNGETWGSNPIDPVGISVWRSVVFGGANFVAVGTDSVAVSTNGVSWTLYPAPSSFAYKIDYCYPYFVVIDDSGYTWRSQDGITWVITALPGPTEAQNWFGLAARKQ